MNWFKRREKRKQLRHGFRLHSESLESRALLAGDVFANVLANGTLLISGDAEPNEISVGSADGNITVTGMNDTQLRTFTSDSSTSNLEFSAESVSSIVFDTKAGDDQLTLEGDFGQRGVTIYTGSGQDLANVNSATTGTLAIFMGTGSDEVRVQQTSASGDVDITLGQNGEADSTYVDGLEVIGNLTIHNGGAPDSAEGDSELIAMESMSDVTELRDQQISGDVWISGNSGSQSVSVDNTLVGGDLRLTLGSGDDQASLAQLNVSGGTLANLAAGNDFFQAINSNLNGETTIQGGRGDDHAEIIQSFLADLTTIHGGTGDSYLNIDESSLADVLITGSGGQDDIRVIDSAINGYLSVLTGGGEDQVRVGHDLESDGDYDFSPFASQIRDDATINTGGGNDEVSINALQLDGALTVWAGGGNDALSINDVTAGFFAGPIGTVTPFEASADALSPPTTWFVHTGGGDDDLSFDNSTTTGDLSIITGLGDDRVGAKENLVLGSLRVELGLGRDSLFSNANRANSGSVLQGGLGHDELAEIDADDSSIARSFEAIQHAPELTSSTEYAIPENSALVGDIDSFDGEGDTEGAGLTYSITGGSDQLFFGIDATTGILMFSNAPDFERPLDNGGDNVYDVEVTVTDSVGLTGSGGIRVEVTNLDESDVNAFDDFDPDIDSSQWVVSGGVVNTNFGGSDNSLFFDGNGERSLTTVEVDATDGGTISFELIIGNSSNGGENADDGEDVVLEYSVNDGASWQRIATYDTEDFPTWTTISEPIPGSATNDTLFRWRQIVHSGGGFGFCCDFWGLDNIHIGSI